MSRNVFSRVSGLKPGRSVFDLSHEFLFDCNAGELIPVLVEEMVPGDLFKISNELVVRLQPLVSPVLQQIDVTVHYFFVPYRLCWPEPNGWETFITGGVLGDDTSAIPRWGPGGVPAKGSLWDYMGFPLVNVGGLDRPVFFPYNAYVMIFNEYYRDETLIAKIPIGSTDRSGQGDILKRAWRKDYFTSALPWTQRGTEPALPVVGSGVAQWPTADFYTADADPNAGNEGFNTVSFSPVFYAHNAQGQQNAAAFFNGNTVALNASSVKISELRLSVQIQKWMERNARAGVRYTEFLREHYGTAPRDERLQRPEYIGGSKQPIIISEVLKTSQDGTRPQGNLAGHGLSASANYVAKYHAKEFGLLMGIMSITPKTLYNSQGFDRQFLRRSRYDFFTPEFAHLSEQAIEREEIFATSVLADNRAIWGYQGRYDEMRVRRSKVARNIRDTLSYWAMARNFSTSPALNEAFITCDGSSDPTNNPLTKVFAVPSEPGYVVHFGNKVIASRPMPIASNPGLMDHF